MSNIRADLRRAKLNYLRLPNSESNLIAEVIRAKARFIQTLSKIETRDGWPDPTDESAQSFWTAVEVLTSLLSTGIRPNNTDHILQEAEQRKITSEQYTGWEYEGIPGRISVFVTGDVVRLYLASNNLEAAKPLIDTLQKMQNLDGGWGVCNGDYLSRIRATSWVVGVLIQCLNHNHLQKYIDLDKVSKAITWIYTAQNDFSYDTAWSNVPLKAPSNISATIFALIPLIEAYALNSKGYAFPARPESMKRAIAWLSRNFVGNYQNWRGIKEEFGIEINGKIVGRHVFGGPGNTLLVRVLGKGSQTGLISLLDPLIYNSALGITRRCQRYGVKNEYWLVPADDGGAPLTWNLAYALDAFTLYESYYLEHIAGKWIETETIKSLLRTPRWIEQGTIVLLLAIVGFLIFPYLRFLGQITILYSKLPLLLQGITMISIGLILEAIYNRVIKSFIIPSVRAVSNVLKKGGEPEFYD